MVDTQKIKEWVQHRIDYLEDSAEKQAHAKCSEDIEGRGMLSAFYMVMEFIDGQRR